MKRKQEEKQEMKLINADKIITKEWLASYSACEDGYAWACTVLGEGLTLKEFLPLFNRADWMLWTLKRAGSLTDKMVSVRIAIKCAEAVIDIYEKKYPNDSRPRKAIEAAVAYIKDPSEENRKSAYTAAYAAYAAAYADAYSASAYAAYTAAYAAYSASASAYAAYTDADAYSASAYADAYSAYAYAAYAYADAYSARKSMHKKLCAMILSEVGL